MHVSRRIKALIAGVGVASALAMTWGWVSWQYPLPSRVANPAPTIRLYAGTEEIAVLEGTSHQVQVWVPLSQIPQPVVDGVLVTEDRRFFLHHGIDLLAVLRATGADLWRHKIRQGGSTITQQLARTLFLSNKRTWGRKLHEAIIALALDFRYSKERILEAYLNTVYMGEDGGVAVYGMGAAARRFLHKDLVTVRLDEAALLAAAISAPNRTFSGDAERARLARNSVLQSMREQGVVIYYIPDAWVTHHYVLSVAQRVRTAYRHGRSERAAHIVSIPALPAETALTWRAKWQRLSKAYHDAPLWERLEYASTQPLAWIARWAGQHTR